MLKKQMLPASLVVVISLLAIMGNCTRTRKVLGKISEDADEEWPMNTLVAEGQLIKTASGSWKVPLQGEVALPNQHVEPGAPSRGRVLAPIPPMMLENLERMWKAKYDELMSAEVELSELAVAAKASSNWSFVVAFLNDKNRLIGERDKLREDVTNLADHVAVAKLEEAQAATYDTPKREEAAVTLSDDPR